jgi:hypothetical protein
MKSGYGRVGAIPEQFWISNRDSTADLNPVAKRKSTSWPFYFQLGCCGRVKNWIFFCQTFYGPMRPMGETWNGPHLLLKKFA